MSFFKNGVVGLPPFFVKRVGGFSALSETIPWGIERSNLRNVWELTRGEDVTVVVLDTGYSNHPDNCNEEKGESFCWESDVVDMNGHGSHVAGTIGACDNESGVIGVAPEVRVISCKVMDKFGMGDDKCLYEGLLYCLKNDVDVVNVSMGGPKKMGRRIENVLRRLYHKGTHVICAAGNVGRDNSVLYPARSNFVRAIGATDLNNKIADFSSRGVEVDHAAPGVDILSTYKNQEYAVLDGTSMACPYFAGLVALSVSARRKAGKKDRPVSVVNQIAIENSIDHGPEGQDSKFGYGIVDPLRFVTDVVG